MSRSESTVCHTSADSQNGCRILTVCQIYLDLLKAASYIKASRATAEYLLSAMGETCRNTYRILFCDAAFDELFRQFIRKVGKGYGTS